MNIDIEELITEMQEVKAAYLLSVSEVLKLFEIKAMKDLTGQLRRANNGR